MVADVLIRFMAKIDRSAECWVWVAHLDRHGYGMFYVGGKMVLAHRFSYQTFVGEILPELELDHLCRNTCCVNPAHLEPVTHQMNVDRGDSGLHQRIKTHCPQGHLYSGDNLRINYAGRRVCKACERAKTMRYQARRAD